MQEEDNSNDSGSIDSILDQWKNFTDMHSKEISLHRKELQKAHERYEKLALIETSRDVLIKDLETSVELKTKELEDTQADYENLEFQNEKLNDRLINEMKKSAEIQVLYSKIVQEMEDKIMALENENKNMKIVVDAKEAECAVYLTDMRAQLNEALSQKDLSDQRVADLEVKIIDLEKIVQDFKEEANNFRENIIENHEAQILKKDKKISKKNERIALMKDEISKLEADKKALENKLQIEGCKMRDLQKVLERPYRQVSPVIETEKDEMKCISEVPPIVVEHPPLNKDQSNPNRILRSRLKRPANNDSDEENEVINSTQMINSSQNSAVTVVDKTNIANDELKLAEPNQPNPQHLSTQSEDIEFPVYNASNQNKSFERVPKPIKRFKI